MKNRKRVVHTWPPPQKNVLCLSGVNGPCFEPAIKEAELSFRYVLIAVFDMRKDLLTSIIPESHPMHVVYLICLRNFHSQETNGVYCQRPHVERSDSRQATLS